MKPGTGSVQVNLEADGTFRVYIGAKYDPSTLVASGNVDNRTYRTDAA